jgi:hypothetical protein
MRLSILLARPYSYVSGRVVTSIDKSGLDDKCLEFSIELPTVIEGLLLVLGLKICCEQFDTTCCQGIVASSCTTIAGSIGFSVVIDGGISELERIPEELVELIESVEQTFSGIGNGVYRLASCGEAEKECHKKDYEFVIQICGTACGVIASETCCLGTGPGGGGGCSIDWGPCGEPKLGAELTVGVTICQ